MQQAEQLFLRVDQLIQSGASDDEIEEAFLELDTQMSQAYYEVDAAFEEVMLVEMKTDVLMMAEEAASLKFEINNAKKTGMLNGQEISEAEIKEFEEEVMFLELEVKDSKDNYLEEVRFVNEVFEVRQADMQEEFEAVPFGAVPIKIDFKMASMEMEQELEVQELEIERFQEFEMEAEQQEMELEVKKIEMFYMEPEEFFEELELQQQEQKLYNVGVTTYADLNSISSGSNIYLGDTTALRVFEAAENAASQATVGKTIGSFQATHEINYSTRTITQAADIIIDALGSNTTQRSFTVGTGHSYSTTDSSDVDT